MGLMNRTSSRELFVAVRRGAGPLHAQLEEQLRDGVRSGRLAAGDRLPSSRALAAELGISRGVVVEAYQQLAAEGYLTSRAGSFTRVAAGPEPAARPRPPAPSRNHEIDFCPSRADLSNFPRAAWLRTSRGRR